MQISFKENPIFEIEFVIVREKENMQNKIHCKDGQRNWGYILVGKFTAPCKSAQYQASYTKTAF